MEMQLVFDELVVDSYISLLDVGTALIGSRMLEIAIALWKFLSWETLALQFLCTDFNSDFQFLEVLRNYLNFWLGVFHFLILLVLL